MVVQSATSVVKESVRQCVRQSGRMHTVHSHKRPSARLSRGLWDVHFESLAVKKLLPRNAFCFTRTAFKKRVRIHIFRVVGRYPFRVLYHALFNSL